MASSNGNIFPVTDPLWGTKPLPELLLTNHRPLLRSRDIQLRSLSCEDLKIPINKTRLNFESLKLYLNLQWASELNSHMLLITVMANARCITKLSVVRSTNANEFVLYNAEVLLWFTWYNADVFSQQSNGEQTILFLETCINMSLSNYLFKLCCYIFGNLCVGLHLFNDNTCPSGHTSRPTPVDVSHSCFNLWAEQWSPLILSTCINLHMILVGNCIECLTIHIR